MNELISAFVSSLNQIEIIFVSLPENIVLE